MIVTVKEARQLPAQFSDSYIKLYLSEDGKDISSSKRKTEPHKGTTNPVFEEKFEFKLPANTKLTQQNRVQVTVWNEGGKLSIGLKAPLDTQRALSIAYTPGVAKVCRAIDADPALAARYTWAHRLVAVVSDGSAVLGLGDIGAAASLPVMEGKAALFKTFGGLDSIPIVLNTKDPDEIVDILVKMRPSFGAVNLEDISAPRCFEIEQRVIEALDCPVMHDDQHGTAIVVLAALLGATAVLGREMSSLKMVISGAGAAGVACANILLTAGLSDITLLDSKGIVHSGREDLNAVKAELAGRTNPEGRTGGPAEALEGADVFLGLSAGKVSEELIARMAPGGVVFACSNPDPEIHPEVAKRYAAIVATESFEETIQLLRNLEASLSGLIVVSRCVTPSGAVRSIKSDSMRAAIALPRWSSSTATCHTNRVS